MYLGIIGNGSIGRALLASLEGTAVTRVTFLVRTSPQNPTAVSQLPAAYVTTVDEFLADRPDLVVECAGHGAVADNVARILATGTDVVVASVGALADDALHDHLTQAAAKSGAKLILPTGAIGGLDLLAVLAAAGEVQVTYRGIKPPQAWKGSPADKAVDLDALTERQVFFAGTGRAAALAYPKNANVVAALALAGAGFDKMRVELIADPQATANTHTFAVSSPLCHYTIEISNAATPDNPRTSMTTVASLRKTVLDQCE